MNSGLAQAHANDDSARTSNRRKVCALCEKKLSLVWRLGNHDDLLYTLISFRAAFEQVPPSERATTTSEQTGALVMLISCCCCCCCKNRLIPSVWVPIGIAIGITIAIAFAIACLLAGWLAAAGCYQLIPDAHQSGSQAKCTAQG